MEDAAAKATSKGYGTPLNEEDPPIGTEGKYLRSDGQWIQAWVKSIDANSAMTVDCGGGGMRTVTKEERSKKTSFPLPGLIQSQVTDYGRCCFLSLGRFLLCCCCCQRPDDIGDFAFHRETPGISYLTSTTMPDQNSVQQLIQEIGGVPEATFKSYPDACLLGQKERALLIDKLDQKCGNQNDFKWSVTPQDLQELVGKDNFQKLANNFPEGDFNEIKLRRCCAEGQCINFHTDVSKCTMQIPLNSDTEYSGGRLMFATSEGLQCPSRPAGSATIHYDDVVHGVTRMEQGVRYGLFFLKTEQLKHTS